ncbi:hypothetical protein Tco_1299744, partial [Tanacetum coccineum]
MLTITLIGSSASLAYSIFPESLKTQSYFDFFPLLSPEPQKVRWTDSPQELSIPEIFSERALSKGIAHLPRPQSSLIYSQLYARRRRIIISIMRAGLIPGMTPAQALTAIQTMVDHSQKRHDGTTSRNIRSSNSNDGLAALVGCQIYEGPHLDNDCPLSEEVKQVEK